METMWKIGDRDGPYPTPAIEQARRDFNRERVMINGIITSPGGDGEDESSGFENVLEAVKNMIRQADSTLSESTVDAFSSQVLRETCRTQCGGDAFEAVNLMLSNPDILTIGPSSEQAPPMKLNIRVGRWGSHYSWRTSTWRRRRSCSSHSYIGSLRSCSCCA